MIKIKANQYRFIFAIVAMIGFWSIIWLNIFEENLTGWYSNCPNCWGDWSAHFTYTNSFAWAQPWPLELPVYAGHKFTYPFLIDLFSAGLVRLGMSLPDSFIWPGLILSIGLTYLIYQLAKDLTGNYRTGIITAILFLFNGSHVEDSRWLNIITSQLLPQRGQLPGLILAIIVFHYLWQRRPLLAGVVSGLLPLFHIHSYLVTLAVGIWLGGWKFFLPAAAIGLPQIGFVYGFNPARQFIAIDTFWWQQLAGIIPVLMILILGFIFSPIKLKRFALPFWIILFMSLFFRFQPYNWDNTKFLLYWYLIAAICGAYFLSRLRLVGLIILGFLIYPGIKDVSQLMQPESRYQFFSQPTLAVAETVNRLLEPQAVVLTASNHNHWLPVLTGRQIIMGYPGWLWTYGIDYATRQTDVDKMYQGDQELINQYGINYLIVGPEELNQFSSINLAYFKTNFPLVLEWDKYQVFKISQVK